MEPKRDNQTLNWAWALLTFILTVVLLGSQSYVVMWGAYGTGLGGVLILVFAPILLASVIFNIAWLSFSVLNVALFWDELIYGHTNLVADLGRALTLAVVLNVLLLAIFYARRRSI